METLSCHSNGKKKIVEASVRNSFSFIPLMASEEMIFFFFFIYIFHEFILLVAMASKQIQLFGQNLCVW